MGGATSKEGKKKTAVKGCTKRRVGRRCEKVVEGETREGVCKISSGKTGRVVCKTSAKAVGRKEPIAARSELKPRSEPRPMSRREETTTAEMRSRRKGTRSAEMKGWMGAERSAPQMDCDTAKHRHRILGWIHEWLADEGMLEESPRRVDLIRNVAEEVMQQQRNEYNVRGDESSLCNYSFGTIEDLVGHIFDRIIDADPSMARRFAPRATAASVAAVSAAAFSPPRVSLPAVALAPSVTEVIAAAESASSGTAEAEEEREEKERSVRQFVRDALEQSDEDEDSGEKSAESGAELIRRLVQSASEWSDEQASYDGGSGLAKNLIEPIVVEEIRAKAEEDRAKVERIVGELIDEWLTSGENNVTIAAKTKAELVAEIVESILEQQENDENIPEAQRLSSSKITELVRDALDNRSGGSSRFPISARRWSSDHPPRAGGCRLVNGRVSCDNDLVPTPLSFTWNAIRNGTYSVPACRSGGGATIEDETVPGRIWSVCRNHRNGQLHRRLLRQR